MLISIRIIRTKFIAPRLFLKQVLARQALQYSQSETSRKLIKLHITLELSTPKVAFTQAPAGETREYS